MPNKNVIQVFEWEKLYYDNDTPFTQKHWEALCSYSQKSNRNTQPPVVYFQIINRGIRFTSYVGAIQVGNLTIEILPKVDKATLQQDDKHRWQKVLPQMLEECKWLPAYAVGYASLSLKKQSLLDIYLFVFLNEVQTLLHESLLKTYEPEDGNQSTLKGRLLFSRQMTRNNIHQERFFVRNASYKTGNLFNRILCQAIRFTVQLNRNPELNHTAANLLLQFPDVQPEVISQATFDKLKYDRQTERYRQAMQFAEMLLLHTSPNVTGGDVSTLAILFDMNTLWEEWVYRQLKKEETNFGITVQRQQSTHFWNAPHLPRPKTIRPDVLIEKEGKTIVLDTKWKQLKDGTPTDDDLKQLFVYNLYWQCEQSVLLYPATESATVQQGHYTAFAGMNRSACTCLAVAQSVLNADGKLNRLFGKEVLDKVLGIVPIT